MKKDKLKLGAAMILCLAIALSSQDAFARGWGGDRGGSRAGNRVDDRGGHERYYYRGDRLYRHGWFGFDVAVSALVMGALIDSLPPRHTTVVIRNTPYYYCDNVYYRPYQSGGYVVVPAPVVTQPVIVAPEAAPVVVPNRVFVSQPQPQIPETLTVNIPNSRGGYTSVTMRRSGNGFVGPQGEYYQEHPTVEQLKVLYGR